MGRRSESAIFLRHARLPAANKQVISFHTTRKDQNYYYKTEEKQAKNIETEKNGMEF